MLSYQSLRVELCSFLSLTMAASLRPAQQTQWEELNAKKKSLFERAPTTPESRPTDWERPAPDGMIPLILNLSHCSYRFSSGRGQCDRKGARAVAAAVEDTYALKMARKM